MTISRHCYRFLKLTVAMALAPMNFGATAMADANTASGVSIHRYADFDQRVLFPDSKSISAARPAVASTPQLNVLGKRFVLQLEEHSALLGQSAKMHGIYVQRGSIAGIADSWIRLTRVGSDVHGLLWDGTELYAIEPTAEVGSSLNSSHTAPSGDTVIFKLSDATLELNANYCATANHDHASRNGLAAYQALTAELPTSTEPSNDATPPTLRLEMEVLADAALRGEYESDEAAIAALIVRLNNIDGIYSSKLGLDIQATDIRLLESAGSSLSPSSDPNELLRSLAQLRATTPGMSSYAATHLFTGRDLDGDTLGIAYIGNLCEARYAASVSEMRNRGAWLDSLVAAHELGHQLGAVHDGTGACSDTPSEGYLMSNIINGSDEFSSCSREQILSSMQRAACLVPINQPIGNGTGGAAAGHTSPVAPQQGGSGAFALSWLLLLSALCRWRAQLVRDDMTA